jgi:hypothetical protein
MIFEVWGAYPTNTNAVKESEGGLVVSYTNPDVRPAPLQRRILRDLRRLTRSGNDRTELESFINRHGVLLVGRGGHPVHDAPDSSASISRRIETDRMLRLLSEMRVKQGIDGVPIESLLLGEERLADWLVLADRVLALQQLSRRLTRYEPTSVKNWASVAIERPGHGFGMAFRESVRGRVPDEATCISDERSAKAIDLEVFDLPLLYRSAEELAQLDPALQMRAVASGVTALLGEVIAKPKMLWDDGKKRVKFVAYGGYAQIVSALAADVLTGSGTYIECYSCGDLVKRRQGQGTGQHHYCDLDLCRADRSARTSRDHRARAAKK